MNAVPKDYDSDPERFRTNVKSVEKFGLQGDVHEPVVDKLVTAGVTSILDLGCGEGRFTRPAREQGLSVVAFDYSRTMLTAVAKPAVQGDANELPFASNQFEAVVALYMLYHLANPRLAIAESQRVLRNGGWFIVSVPSRHNDPELASILPQSKRTFDAENGLEMIRDYFQNIEVERWDDPLVHLPDQNALRHYLRGRQLNAETIDTAVATIKTPLTLTKRGALFVARKS